MGKRGVSAERSPSPAGVSHYQERVLWERLRGPGGGGVGGLLRRPAGQSVALGVKLSTK